MEATKEGNDSQLPIEERRLRLDEKRLLLDNTVAKKWLPTLATLMVGLIAGMFGYVQQQMSPAISSIAALCLAASLAYGSKLLNQTAQENKTQCPANQQSSSDATSQEEMNFKLLIMSNGV